MANTRKNGKLSKVQHCTDCGCRIEPLMIIGNEPDEWLWPFCYNCDDMVCPDCKIEHKDEIYCNLCYQSIALSQRKVERSVFN